MPYRLGVPDWYIEIVKDIYTGNTFSILGTGHTSAPRARTRGILQGCPLSPFLFVIIMSVICKEVRLEYRRLRPHDAWPHGLMRILEVAYADDLTLMSASARDMQLLVQLVEKHATMYGLTLNARKVKLLITGTGPTHSVTVSGTTVHPTDKQRHLGGQIRATGGDAVDVAYRISAAKADYYKLAQVCIEVIFVQGKSYTTSTWAF